MALTGLSLLTGCAVGPDYRRPTVATPAAWQAGATSATAAGAGAGAEARQGEPAAAATVPWQPAATADASLPSAWWELYGDARLNELIAQLDAGNQDLRAAEARHRQALALAGDSWAGYFPTLDASLGSKRQEAPGGNRSTQHTLGLETIWEVDVWGRVRRQVEADRADADASAADLAAARLSLQAALVQAYLQLRVGDARQRLLADTVANYERALTITRNRHAGGVSSQGDVAQAEAQLKNAQGQSQELQLLREQLQHTIALLLGKLPGEVAIAPDTSLPTLPSIPPALPSTLLERRPDVAAAERRVASANAGIGVAQAAFFPRLALAASGGYQDSGLADLIAAPHRFWALGPASLALNLFEGGRHSARKRQAMAAHEESVANYRQTVLAAFAEVEDQLSALRLLATEKSLQDEATQAALRFQDLTGNQYLAGTVSYLNVTIANASALAAERDSLNLLDRQLQASVQLLRALGGGDRFPATP